MNNNFVKQFGENIYFFYSSFDRVIIRGKSQKGKRGKGTNG